MNKIKNATKGFTLLELLVVVLIIGILAAIAMPQYQKAKIKAEFAEAYTKLKAAAQIEEMCRLQTGAKQCNGTNNYIGYLAEVNTEVNGCRRIDQRTGWCLDVEDISKEKFFVFLGGQMSSDKMLASANYVKEDVCLCITKNYKFVLSQGECSDTPSKKYSEILGIPDVTDDNEDYGCYCC